MLSPCSYIIKAFSLSVCVVVDLRDGCQCPLAARPLSQIFLDLVVVDLPVMGVVPWQLGLCLTADFHWSSQARPHRDERGFEQNWIHFRWNGIRD